MYFNGTRSFFLVLSCFLSFSLMAKDVKPIEAGALKKPLCFIENKGQVIGEDNGPCASVQYKLSTPGMSLFVGNGRLSYQFRKISDNKSGTPEMSIYRMNVSLLGASSAAHVESLEEQGYFERFYTSNSSDDGIVAHAYNKVIYKEVYPGIDWVLYVKNDKVEYDFVVRPGGNVADIKLQYGGATKLSMTGDGGIIAETPVGKVEEKKPFSYEAASGRPVASAFVLHNNVVSFNTANYTGTLTIDPFLQWSTYFGGVAEDVVTSVQADASGNTYASGYSSRDPAFILTGSGGMFTTNSGLYDAFVVKYSPSGSILWSDYYGGTGDDRSLSMAVDNANNVYLAGTTTSPGMSTGGAFHAAYLGATDGFLAKFTPTGARAWCTYYGGTGTDYASAVVCETGGANVYIAGITSSTSQVAFTSSAVVYPIYQNALSGLNDAFVAKFLTTTGACVWSTYYGGTSQDQAFALAWDPTINNLYVGGQTSSIIAMASTIPAAYQSTLRGTNDAFIARFSSSGTRTYGTYFGGPGVEQINAMVCHPTTGALAVVGNTTSSTNIATARSHQPAYGGGLQDAFLSVFANSGALNWSTYYGGTAPEYGEGICLDQFNNIVIAGGSFSSNGIASPAGTFAPQDASKTTRSGDYDAFMSKFNFFGQRLWGTYWGGVNYDYANSVTCDLANDRLTLGGYTTSTFSIGITPPVSQYGPAQPAFGGGTYDGFISKFSPDTLVWINQTFTDTIVCAGGTLQVNFTSNFNFQLAPVTNTFTVQLSDASGSFASPVAIGSIASTPSTTSGVINCVIPAGTPLGTHYRIRIVASIPQYVSPDNNIDIDVRNALSPTVVTGNTPVCVGYTLSLIDDAPYAVTSYTWSGPAGSGFGGAGFTSTLHNPINTGVSGGGVTLVDAGVYSVTTTHNGCPALTSTLNVVVNGVHPPLPTDSASHPVCAGRTLYLFSDMGLSTAGHTYRWSGPGLFSSTLQNPVISSPISGTYFVNDTVAGCASTSFFSISVQPILTVSNTITVSPNDTVCAGAPVSFVAHPVNGGVSPTYQWMSGPGSPITGAVFNTFSSSSLLDGETIFCQVTSNTACPLVPTVMSNTVTMNVISNAPVVHIYASPGSNVPAGTTVILNSLIYNGGIGPLYQWKKNNVDIPGATSSVYLIPNVTSSDTLTLEVISTMECTTPAFATSNMLVIQTNVGTTTIAGLSDDLTIYPNPNTGIFSLQGTINHGQPSVASIEVVNPLGQVIYTSQTLMTGNELSKDFDLANVPTGVYLLRINCEGQSKTLRFAVQH